MRSRTHSVALIRRRWRIALQVTLGVIVGGAILAYSIGALIAIRVMILWLFRSRRL